MKEGEYNMKTISLKQFIKENTPEGMEYDPYNSTPKNIVFKEKVKSTRWEDLHGIAGFFTCDKSEVYGVLGLPAIKANENIYATKDQCEAHLAQAKLSQIMKRVNGDWKPDWTNATQVKWCITLCKGVYEIQDVLLYHTFLVFKTRCLAEQVLRENKDLLEQYKPLAAG